MPSILVLACATDETQSRKLAHRHCRRAGSAVPARNSRRFRYRSFGVISEDGMSAVFLISMRFALRQEYVRHRRGGFDGFSYLDSL